MRTGKQICFYWINNDRELVRCEYIKDPFFSSDDDRIIVLPWSIRISSNRTIGDDGALSKEKWTGKR